MNYYDKERKESLCLLWLIVAGVIFITGGMIFESGYHHTLKPYFPPSCSQLDVKANVLKVYNMPSSFTTGSSVVKFSYNSTAYDTDVVKTCFVNLHNTWPNDQTIHHYPIDSSQIR